MRLSASGDRSCASCHDPERYFTEPRARSIGATGEPLAFNAPSLLNVAYAASFGWAAPGVSTLEAAVRRPLAASNELATDRAALESLWGDPEIQRLVRRAEPGATTLSLEISVRALAAYLRTLVENDGPLARYLFDGAPLPDPAARGLGLFVSPRLGCTRCHRGPLLSGPTVTVKRAVAPTFYTTGVSSQNKAQLDAGASSAIAFRAPSLLFVAHTSPYMHDGSLATLESVIDFYARGGGIGADLTPFELSAQERAELLAFLRLL